MNMIMKLIIVCVIGKENIKNNSLQEIEPTLRLSDIYL